MKIYTSLIREGVLLIYRIESDDTVGFTSHLVNHPYDRYFNYFRKVGLKKKDGKWSANNHDKSVIKELISSIELHLQSLPY